MRGYFVEFLQRQIEDGVHRLAVKQVPRTSIEIVANTYETMIYNIAPEP